MITDTIEHYTIMGGKPVILLLQDAKKKAFNKITYKVDKLDKFLR